VFVIYSVVFLNSEFSNFTVLILYSEYFTCKNTHVCDFLTNKFKILPLMLGMYNTKKLRDEQSIQSVSLLNTF